MSENDIDIVWHGPAVPELEDKIREELVGYFEGESPKSMSDLILHTVFLGDYEKDPVITCWGVDGDHRLHAEYSSRIPAGQVIDLNEHPDIADNILPQIEKLKRGESDE